MCFYFANNGIQVKIHKAASFFLMNNYPEDTLAQERVEKL